MKIKKNKKIGLSVIIVLLLSCFLIFSGAKCDIKEGVLKGTSPAALDKDDVEKAVTGFANILAGAASTIAIIFIVIGGIQYITAGGNQEQAGKAKSTLTWAVIGFILIIVSYGIINEFVNILTKK